MQRFQHHKLLIELYDFARRNPGESGYNPDCAASGSIRATAYTTA